jgi:hypothetical protein
MMQLMLIVQQQQFILGNLRGPMGKFFVYWYLRQILSKPFLRSIDWTKEERVQFDLFCRSACGMRLFEFLRQLVANATFRAVYQNSVSANGHARGMQDILGALHKLRNFPVYEESDQESLDEALSPGERSPPDSWRPPVGGRGAIG